VLIGDSGGNQTGMKAVSEKLDQQWADSSTRIHFVPAYYDFPSVAEWLTDQGIHQTPEGLHDDFAMTAMMMAVDPDSVRAQQRIRANRFRINGVNLAPIDSTVKWGHRIIAFRAEATVKAIRKLIGDRPESP
jgi:creatinine amidohydrolase/Fe(II)-dependent formamide hydrolase-like protein